MHDFAWGICMFCDPVFRATRYFLTYKGTLPRHLVVLIRTVGRRFRAVVYCASCCGLDASCVVEV